MPTTTGKASEFITFSRTSNATVTDSDGKIKWAPHNLLSASEQFDASSWTKASITVTANAIASPNGTTTADAIIATTANAPHVINQPDLTVLNTSYTLSVYARANGYNYIALQFSNNSTFTKYYEGVFNLSNGTVEPTSRSVTYTGSRATPVDVGNGWYRLSITIDSVDANATSRVQAIVLSTNDPTTTYAGNGTSGILLWGASLTRADLGGMKANTSAYPMYNPTTPKNLLGYTEDFTNAYWTKFRSNATVTTNTTAPNGLSTADKLVPQNGLASGGVYNTAAFAVVAGSSYTAAVYAKAAELGFVFVALNLRGSTTSQAVCVNLATGARSNEGASATYTVTDVGNGWWRISCTGPATNTVGYLEVYPLAAAGSVNSYTGDGTSGIYLWGAQLSDSASLDAYVPNYGAAPTAAAYYGPRLDYDPVTLAAKGLLVEEARTNLLLHSAALDDAAWLKLIGGTGVLPVVTANAGAAPDGTSTADRVQFDRGAGTTASDLSRVFQDAADPGSGKATMSVWMKSFDGVSSYSVYLLNGSGASVVTVTGAWQRFVLSSTGTSSNFQILLQGNLTQQNADILVWGAQFEYGDFATSYIPTGAATATRAADVASVSTQAFPYSSTEGTLVVNASSPCIAAIANMITLDNGTTQERIRLLTDVASVKTIITESNTTQANLAPGSATANTPFKFAVAYKVNDFAAVVNGSAAATDTAGNVPVVNIARLGADSSGNYLNGHIRQITYIPRRLSNTELQARTV